MSVRAIEPAEFPWFDYKRYTFSLGLAWDGHAWLSGHSASEYEPGEGIVVKGGMADQTRTAYAKIAAILGGAGLTLADAHKIVHWVTEPGLPHAAEADAVRAEILGPDHPGALATGAVGRLLRPAAWIEIEVVAGSAPSGLAYAPSTIAPTAGPVADEVRAVLDRIEATLAARGATIGGLCRTVVTCAPGVDAGEVGAALEAALGGRGRPAVTVNTVPRLADPAARVAIDAIATTATPDPLGDGDVPDTVTAAGFVFCSGPGAATATAGVDVATQSKLAFEHLGAILDRAGTGVDRLVKTVEYVTPDGLPGYREVADVRAGLLTAPFPASTGLICASLPAEGQLFEVDAIALA